LWIFGDDDFIDHDEALTVIVQQLEAGCSFLVLNRCRKSFDLKKLISANWMDVSDDRHYSGLSEFVKEWGLISIIGFISVNIFKRAPFFAAERNDYYGTMYPQLGMMVEAFAHKPVRLIASPLVCHRTQTAEEKRAALGNKASEKNFMANAEKRNALYFGLPFVRLLNQLFRINALSKEEIKSINELVFSNRRLLEFVISNLLNAREIGCSFGDADARFVLKFFQDSECSPEEIELAKKAVGYLSPVEQSSFAIKTISVITPSFNQGRFVRDCVESVARQTFSALEHLVFDPGSTDGSLEVVKNYPHVTLVNERDRGQSDAVNKGFLAAKGEVIAWVNSDDYYFDDRVFERVLRRFNQADMPDIVYGRGIFTDENDEFLRNVYINKDPSTLCWRLQQEDGILQPALFMKKSVVERVGLLSQNNHYSMDYEYWIRCLKSGMKFAFIDDNLAVARYHKDNKTFGQRENSYREVCDMIRQQFGYANHIWLRRYAEYIVEGFDGVIQHSGVTVQQDSDLVQAVYRGLLRAYNADYDTLKLLKSKASERGYGDTLRELINHGLDGGTPCFEIPMDRGTEPGHVCYTVAERRWAFEWSWKKQQIDRSHEFLKNRMRLRNSDVCVIVGNGPSLNHTDLSLLKDVDVIISNNAFLSESLSSAATYYTVVNYLVAEQSSSKINRLQNVYKILPYWLSYCLNADDRTFFVDAMGKPEFSTDILKNMSWRHTVSFFNMHLAYGLGYKKVCLIGFDHSYNQASGSKEEQVLVCLEDDDNHFHKDYFKGMKWQAADVGNMEAMYKLAKDAFENDGREIVNCTVGGRLELFRRGDLASELAGFLKRCPDGDDAIGLPLVGPFVSSQCAHVDENLAVRSAFESLGIQNGRMIDVGAHHGWAMKPFAELGWSVDAFEPDPKNRAVLSSRTADCSNVTIHALAVSDRSQDSVDFFSSEESTGISSLRGFRESHRKSSEVSVTTLTDFLSGRIYGDVDYLKIDAEGFDYHVLKGFPWDRYKPAVVLCEFEDSKTLPLGYDFQDLGEMLMRQGYKVIISEWHPIEKYGIQHNWCRMHRFPARLKNPHGWGNLIAFRSSEMLDAFVSAMGSSVTNKEKVDTLEAERVDDFQIEILSATSVDLKWNVQRSQNEFQIFRFHEGKWTFLFKISGDKRNCLVELPKPGKYAFLVKSVVGDSIIEGPILWTNSWTPDTKREYDRRNSGVKVKRANRWEKQLGFAYPAARIVSRVFCWYMAVFKRQPRAHSLCLLSVILLFGMSSMISPTIANFLAVLAFSSYVAVVSIAWGRMWFNSVLSDRINRVSDTVRIAVGNALEQERNETKSKLLTISDQLSKIVLNQNEVIDCVDRGLANLKVEISKLNTSFVSGDIVSEGIISCMKEYSESLRQDIRMLIDPLNERVSALAVDSQTIAVRLDEIDGFHRSMVGNFDVLAEVEKETKRLGGGIAAHHNCMNKAGIMNNHYFQSFNRFLTKECIEIFRNKWCHVLDLEIPTPAVLGYMASRICLIESMLDGRLATNVEDMILRILVAKSVGERDLSILEIGSLFGVGILVLHDALRARSGGIRITGIDPLSGYYADGVTDSYTDVPVSRKVFDLNVGRISGAANSISIIQKLSTSEGVADMIEDESLTLLIIDGDHSYQGVMNDYHLYWRKVMVGGCIVFDDYGSKEWPDVKKFVDDELGSNKNLVFLGSEWRTAVFRVI
jgi:FkbM family methyltransferase